MFFLFTVSLFALTQNRIHPTFDTDFVYFFRIYFGNINKGGLKFSVTKDMSDISFLSC